MLACARETKLVAIDTNVIYGVATRRQRRPPEAAPFSTAIGTPPGAKGKVSDAQLRILYVSLVTEVIAKTPSSTARPTQRGAALRRARSGCLELPISRPMHTASCSALQRLRRYP